MSNQNIPNAERGHHPYSPSTLQYLEACPCYQSRSEANVKAIIGTLQHGVTETGSDDMRLSDDEAAAAAECLDFVERRKQLMNEARQRAIQDAIHAGFVSEHAQRCLKGDKPEAQEIFDRKQKLAEDFVPQIEEIIEPFLPIDECFTVSPVQDAKTGKVRKAVLSATTAGYADRVLIDHTRRYAEVFDWKFGMWEIEEAENNTQGIAYCLGLFKRLPTLEKVRIYFKQPALDLLTSAVFTREQLAELYLRIMVIVERAKEARSKNDYSTANPNIPGCLFCAHIGRCPKVCAYACNVGKKFYPLEIPQNITPTMVLNSRDASIGLKLASIMDTWAKAFKRQTTDRVLCQEADMPEGYTIQSRADRKIVDMAAYKKAVLNHITEKEWESLLDVSLTAVEKMIADKAPRGMKTDVVRAFKEEMLSTGIMEKDEPYSFLKVATRKTRKSDD